MIAIFGTARPALARLVAVLSNYSRKFSAMSPKSANTHTPSAKPAPAPPESGFSPESLNTQELARNMRTVVMKSQKLLLDFVARMSARENPGPIDPLNISGAMMALAKAMGSDREAV